MNDATRPSLWQLSGAIAIAACGGFLLWAYYFSTTQAITPRNDLTRLEGIPRVDRIDQHRANATVTFLVDGHRIEYRSDEPNFDSVYHVLRSGKPWQFRVSSKRQTVFPRHGLASLYEVKGDDEIVLDYDTTVAHRLRSAQVLLLLGALIALAGLVGIAHFFWARKRGAPVAPNASARVLVGSIWLFMVGTTMLPEQRDNLVTRFGPAPFGVPVLVLAIAVVTVLFLPLLWLWPHVGRIGRQACFDGYCSKWHLAWYLLRVGWLRPELRWSQCLAWLGFLYLLFVIGAVVVCTTS